MRRQTHAYRVAHGTSMFITFSPSEKDSAIMLRLMRARQGDPAIAEDKNKAFYARDAPQLDVDFCRLSVEELAKARFPQSFFAHLDNGCPNIPSCSNPDANMHT